MAKRVGKVPTEPVQISSRFTLRLLSLDHDDDDRSLWSSRIFAAVQLVFDGSADPSTLAEAGSGLKVRMTDLATGRSVDDVIGAWNTQVERDFDNTVNGLRQMSDTEILQAFFEQALD